MNLIKYFSGVEEDFVRLHFKNIQEGERLIARYRKRATITVAVVISFAILMFVAIGYANVNIRNTKNEMTRAENIQTQFDQCAETLQQQQADAASAQASAEEAHKNVAKQLEECSRKRAKR